MLSRGQQAVLLIALILHFMSVVVLPLVCKSPSLLQNVDIGGIYFRLVPAGTCRNINSSDIEFWVQPPRSTVRSKPHLISLEDEDEKLKRYFDPNLPTAVYVHGFFEGAQASSLRAFRSAYLLRKDHNFMAVNWQLLASAPWYPNAVLNYPLVASTFAKMLDRLVTIGAIQLETLHLLGFSLGAHVCGAASKQMAVGRVPRITALDPANPLITLHPSQQHLDNTSAEFVDVVHTCGGLYGLYSPVGHVDFYPNGGTYVQPGCWTFTPVTCSHWRSWRFYIESMMGSEFEATSCDSWMNYRAGKCDNNQKVFMGHDVDRKARGVFYLHTSWHPPFALT